MKTARRRNPKQVPVLIVAVIILAALACNLLIPAQETAQGNDPQTQDEPTQPSAPVENQPIPTNQPETCLAGIVAGKTTRSEVIAVLGDPVFTQQDGGYDSLFYGSSLTGQYNTITLRDQIVERVSVVLGEESLPRWSTVTSQHGQPPVQAFSTYLQGSRLFAFPEQGLQYIAHVDLDVVFIQDCFIPMSIEIYKTTFSNLLLVEDPFIQ